MTEYRSKKNIQAEQWDGVSDAIMFMATLGLAIDEIRLVNIHMEGDTTKYCLHLELLDGKGAKVTLALEPTEYVIFDAAGNVYKYTEEQFNNDYEVVY